MSGICGFWLRDGALGNSEQIERMSAALAHRGPNGARTWRAGSAALAHQMLHATPESLAERLPFVEPDSGLAITADARLDNREELARALGITDVRELADSELILAAYGKWGPCAPERLLGDFAFAIWDPRREELFCARDHFGVKPFYYAETQELVAFASEIKGLLALDNVPWSVDERSVAAYLSDDLEDLSGTFYRGVLRLPPAHWMKVGRQGVRVERYWSLDPLREMAHRSDQEYEEQFRSIFEEAVRCRCRTARPLAAQLSGGLDSSAITCVARDLLAREGRGPLTTFSLCFPETPECDEGPFIRAMVTRGGIEPQYVQADGLSPLDDWEKVLWHLEEPSAAPHLYLHWGLYGAACREGVGVMLDGLDGDAVVSHGDGYLSDLARSGRWYRWLREASGLRRIRGAGYRALLWHAGVSAMLPRLRRAEQTPASEIMTRALAECRGQARVAELDGGSVHRQWHYRNLASGTLTHVLEMADKAAAAFGIEVRHPFLDKRLAEFCLALPGSQKLSRGWDRAVMRRALHSKLPGEIRWRPDKTDLRPHFVKRLNGANAGLLAQVAAGCAAVAAPYLDSDAVKNVYRRYLQQPRRADDMAVWNSAMLALWLQYVTKINPQGQGRADRVLCAAAGHVPTDNTGGFPWD